MRKILAMVLTVAAVFTFVLGGFLKGDGDRRIWPLLDKVTEVVDADGAEAAVIYTFFCWNTENSGFWVSAQSANPASARSACFNLLGQRFWDWDFWGNWIDCPGTGMSLERWHPAYGPGYWQGRTRRVWSDNPFCSTNTEWHDAVGLFWQ